MDLIDNTTLDNVEFVLYDLRPDQVLVIVRDLKECGYILGVDFDFSYSPFSYEAVDGEYVTSRRSTTFKFYQEQHATWFALKYG